MGYRNCNKSGRLSGQWFVKIAEGPLAPLLRGGLPGPVELGFEDWRTGLSGWPFGPYLPKIVDRFQTGTDTLANRAPGNGVW